MPRIFRRVPGATGHRDMTSSLTSRMNIGEICNFKLIRGLD